MGKSVAEIFREFLGGGHRKKHLHYYLGCSSGAPVSEKIPVLLSRRAGWATRQGASFIELYTGPPSELIMEKEGLINVAAQLGLNYSIHPSERLGLDSSYIRAGEGGYSVAQDYLRKIIIYAGLLKQELEERTAQNPLGKKTLTSINIHISNKPIPPVAERLASDVSVDPFGNDIRIVDEKSPIFGNKDFRERFLKYYIFQKEDKEQIIGFLAPRICRDFFEKISEKYVDELFEKYGLSEFAKKEGRNVEKMNFMDKMSYVKRAGYENILNEKISKDPDLQKEVKRSFRESVEGLKLLWGRINSLNSDLILQESFIFRELLPRWMPHAKEAGVKNIWKGITGKKSGNIDSAEKEFKKLKEEVRGEERMIAAVAGAYAWGHVTQYKDWAPGVKKFEKKKVELAKLLDFFGIQLTLECHMSTALGETIRLFAPEDILVVAKAINKTTKKEIARITIDMEQISTMGVDPLWTIKGSKLHGYKGLKNGDGRYIRVVHVTHPYVMSGGSGHQHGPVRRGDTQIFEYLYSMVEKGMAQNPKEPTIIMYEIGTEKAETVYMIRLILEMISAGITPNDLKVEKLGDLMEREPRNLEEKLIQEFFGLGEAEMRQEWTTIHEHAFDPLKGMLWSAKPDHTWTGKAAIERRNQPDEYKKEEYR